MPFPPNSRSILPGVAFPAIATLPVLTAPPPLSGWSAVAAAVLLAAGLFAAARLRRRQLPAVTASEVHVTLRDEPATSTVGIPVSPGEDPRWEEPSHDAAQRDADRTADMATDLRELADRLEELAGAASARADSGSEHLNAVAGAVEELSAAIGVVGENASRSARASERVVEESRRLAGAVDLLRESTDAIGTVIGTVREVAENTRILALNATIEAARVGEAGRGFAVVAGEVKALAQQTAEITAGIEERIAAVRRALAQVEEVARTVDSEAEAANEAAAAIAAAVEEQSAAAAEISTRVRELATAGEELARLLGTGTPDRPGLLALARELERDAEGLEAQARRTADHGGAGATGTA